MNESYKGMQNNDIQIIIPNEMRERNTHTHTRRKKNRLMRFCKYKQIIEIQDFFM